MKIPAQTIRVSSHAIGLGFTEANVPACLILSTDSLTQGGDIAIQAKYFVLEGENLRLSGEQGSVIIEGISQMCRDAVIKNLPLIVIDPANETEAEIDRVVDDLRDIFKEQDHE
jgi:hypothetical protein